MHPILTQVYGAELKPQLQTVLHQLAVVEKAYCGLSMDFSSYLVRLKDTDEASDPFITLKNGGTVLVRLCSLLHSPSQLTHHLDETLEDSWFLPESYEKHNDSFFKQRMDLSFATFHFKNSRLPGDNVHLDWKPVEKSAPGIEKYHSLALNMTTAASPATLSLFVNKGPAQPLHLPGSKSYDSKWCNTHLCFHAFSSPEHNIWHEVQPQRVRDLMDTISGKVKDKDLVSHSVCIIPYSIRLMYSRIVSASFLTAFGSCTRRFRLTQNIPLWWMNSLPDFRNHTHYNATLPNFPISTTE